MDAPGDVSSGQLSDERLRPGGPHGSAFDVGLSGIDRDKIPGRGESPRQEDFGSPPELEARVGRARG